MKENVLKCLILSKQSTTEKVSNYNSKMFLQILETKSPRGEK
jgi:hypothetical protein